MSVKEIDGQHYIDAKVVMFETYEPSYLHIIQRDLLTRKKGTLEIHDSPWKSDEDFKAQGFYILTDEKPNKGDLVYDYAHDKIGKFNGLAVDGGSFSDHAKKIIASTQKIEVKDKLLSSYEGDYVPKYTHQIPREFFSEFVEAYNNGSKITDVLVEVENKNSGWRSLADSGKVGSTVVPDEFELKIYNGNFINITTSTKNWNDLAKIAPPEKWIEMYIHYQELLLENDTREFLENIPKPSWDDIYRIVNTVEFNSKIEIFNYLKKNFNPPFPINKNC